MVTGMSHVSRRRSPHVHCMISVGGGGEPHAVRDPAGPSAPRPPTSTSATSRTGTASSGSSRVIATGEASLLSRRPAALLRFGAASLVEREGLIAPKPGQSGDWVFITQRRELQAGR